MYKTFVKNIPKLFFKIDEPKINGSEGIYIGRMKQSKTPFFWNYKKLINQHIAIVGMTGSGKSYLIKTIIVRAMLAKNIPSLILDWTGEYSSWVEKAGGKVVDINKTGFNIMDKEQMDVKERVKLAISSFDLLLDLQKFPEERIEIEEALEKEFKKKRPSLEGLEKRVRKAKRIIKTLRIKGGSAIEKGIGVKDLFMKGLVSVDLSGLASDEIKSLIGLTILQLIKEKMRRTGIKEKKDIDMIVVLDEAWKIAKEESDVVVMIREGRKYNFSIIVASQNPTDINKTIFSNAGTIFVFRTMLKEYKEYIKDSLTLDKEKQEILGALGTGEAIINVALSGSGNKTFILKVEGEQFLFNYKLGDKMEIDRERLTKILLAYGLDNKEIALIKEEFNKKEGEMELSYFVKQLIKNRIELRKIYSILMDIGIKEEEIIEVFYNINKGYEVEVDEDKNKD